MKILAKLRIEKMSVICHLGYGKACMLIDSHHHGETSVGILAWS